MVRALDKADAMLTLSGVIIISEAIYHLFQPTDVIEPSQIKRRQDSVYLAWYCATVNANR